MKIKTKRLILRDLKDEDAKDIARNAHNPDIFTYTDRIPFPYTLEKAREWIKSSKKDAKQKPRKDYGLVIELKQTGEVIGSIGIHNVDKDHKKAGIGYWIGKKFRRKGYISEAEEKMLKFGFNKLKLNKIYGQCVVSNKGSCKLFKKFGFRKIGIEKEELIKNNKELGIENLRQDAYRWELLKENWEEKD